VRFQNSLDLLSRSDLVNVIGKKSTEARIQKYCSKMDLTPLWEVQPDIVCALQRKRTNLEVQLDPVYRERTNSENRSPKNESRLTERLVAIENKISRRENSLQDMLAKLENRIASIEKKLSKVDEVEKTTKKLASTIVTLTTMVSKLEEQIVL
jgi:CII-binding regulator of phage lambda lysogenization HflD